MDLEPTITEDDAIITALWGAGYTGSMEGGITIGGSAKCVFQLTPPVSYGGVTIGGKATTTVKLSRTMTGGIVVKGGYDVSGNFVSIGASMGGTAGVSVTRAYRPTGGVSVGGSAVVTSGTIQVGKGGVTVGGSASYTPAYKPVARGGVSIGGTAVVRVSRTVTMSGGVTIGGQAGLGSGYRYTMTGGITTGGSATYKPGLKFTTRGGGISMGGKAAFQFNLYYTGSGGISTGGKVTPPKVSTSYTGTGGVTISGTAKVLWGKLYTMTGGITTGGTAGKGSGLQVNYGYKPEFPHNRVFLYGKASYGRNSYSHTMTGGIIVKGGYKSDFCTNTCDTRDPFFRDAEALVGCPVRLPNGKIDYICARPIEFLPIDTIKAIRAGALVPASTVCRQALYAKKSKERNCSAVIRR